VNVFSGGQFKPGNSPGSVTTGDATWNSDGHFVVEMNDALGTPGANWDYWEVNGEISLLAGTTASSKFVLELQSYAGLATRDFDYTQDYEWPIASATDGIIGFDPAEITLDSSGFINPLNGGHFSVVQSGNSIDLAFTAPEPASFAILIAGCLCLVAGGYSRRITRSRK
jgi:hypothetical protein